MHLKRMCFLWLLGGVFYKCQLGKLGGWCSYFLLSLLIFLSAYSRDHWEKSFEISKLRWRIFFGSLIFCSSSLHVKACYWIHIFRIVVSCKIDPFIVIKYSSFTGDNPCPEIYFLCYQQSCTSFILISICVACIFEPFFYFQVNHFWSKFQRVSLYLMCTCCM